MRPTLPLLVANWKMALDHKQSKEVLQKVQMGIKDSHDVQVVICPSFTSLFTFKNMLSKSGIEYGAQDCFWEDTGAYTGEVSPADLKSLGCSYVILGHSERRKFLAESNEMVHKKIRTVLEQKMTPIVCVGENWEQRSENKRDYVLIQQLTEALDGISLDPHDRLIVAYEPVWAISTGEGIEPEPQEVEYANQVIRHVLLDLFRKEVVDNNTRLLYGGSVKPGNVDSFLELNSVSGVLVGGASQKTESFLELIEVISS